MSTPLKRARAAAPYRLDDQIGFLLRLASQRHAAIFQGLISEELTPTQFAAIMRVAEHGELSQNQLGRLTAMDVATIKGVVDRLVKKGLLDLSPDPQDRRRVTIQLSDKAAAMLEALEEAGHAISRDTLEPLSAEERRTLLRLIQKIT